MASSTKSAKRLYGYPHRVILKYSQRDLAHLRAVFDKIREQGLKMKMKKCNVFQTETKYLGFTINGEGIHPDPEKVEAIREMAAPCNVGVGEGVRRDV